MKSKLFFLMFFLLSMFSCKLPENSQTKSVNISYIKISVGGGFAGKYDTYKVNAKGYIFKDDLVIGAMKENVATQLIENYDFLSLSKFDHIKYGNYTYSIERFNKGNTHKLIWTKNEPGTEIFQKYYNIALNLIQKNSIKNKGIPKSK